MKVALKFTDTPETSIQIVTHALKDVGFDVTIIENVVDKLNGELKDDERFPILIDETIDKFKGHSIKFNLTRQTRYNGFTMLMYVYGPNGDELTNEYYDLISDISTQLCGRDSEDLTHLTLMLILVGTSPSEKVIKSLTNGSINIMCASDIVFTCYDDYLNNPSKYDGCFDIEIEIDDLSS